MNTLLFILGVVYNKMRLWKILKIISGGIENEINKVIGASGLQGGRRQ